MWLATRIAPPLRGTYDIPDQWRYVIRVSHGLSTTTAKRRQNPSLRRPTTPPTLRHRSANHACPPAPPTREGRQMRQDSRGAGRGVGGGGAGEATRGGEDAAAGRRRRRAAR